MKSLTVEELQGVLNSDMKLWEIAETEQPTPTTVIKKLYLPYGIGETTIALEGLHDAGTKAGGVASYGQYIRSLVEDRTDDEAIEARAKQAAARVEQEDIENGIYVGQQGVPNPSPLEAPFQRSAQVHQGYVEEPAGLGETLVAQRAELRERVHRAQANLTQWKKELRALDAACAAMEDDSEDEGGPPVRDN